MNYPSQARRQSMELTLAELGKVACPVICEVGRARNEYAGESDGHSTLVWASLPSAMLVSIDIHPETEVVCRKLLSPEATDWITFINDDAIEFFFGREAGIKFDLLYLDGWDLNDPDSAKQHLICFLLADACIKPGGLVLVDDTGTSDLGKGKLAVPVAVLMGWTILFQGYQTLLRKPI